MNSDKLKQSEKLDLHYAHNSFIKKKNQQKLCKSNRLTSVSYTHLTLPTKLEV